MKTYIDELVEKANKHDSITGASVGRLLQHLSNADSCFAIIGAGDKDTGELRTDELNQSVTHIVRSDADIDIIIYEEIQPYLVGDKSIDDVIKIMNDRARTLIIERK